MGCQWVLWYYSPSLWQGWTTEFVIVLDHALNFRPLFKRLERSSLVQVMRGSWGPVVQHTLPPSTEWPSLSSYVVCPSYVLTIIRPVRMRASLKSSCRADVERLTAGGWGSDRGGRLFAFLPSPLLQGELLTPPARLKRDERSSNRRPRNSSSSLLRPQAVDALLRATL